jgi:hypothetical protein
MTYQAASSPSPFIGRELPVAMIAAQSSSEHKSVKRSADLSKQPIPIRVAPRGE